MAAKWQVHRSRKDEGDVAQAELVATFDSRREAYEYIATNGLYEEYSYLVVPMEQAVAGRTSTTVTFTIMGRTVGTWQMDNPTMLPGENDRVKLEGELWIVQHAGRRWHGPTEVEIVLAHKANTAYDQVWAR